MSTYPSPRYLAEYIHEETNGIPAYVRQLTQQISRRRGKTLPRLHETVRLTIDKFSATAKQALFTIATADTSVSMHVLKHACNLDGETAFAAVQELRFLNFVELLTNDEGDNYIVATEANTLELIRYSLSDGRTKEFHEALATAYEAHRGDIDAIVRHWNAANQSHKAIEYAWHAADQAEGDGDHMRASALLSVCLENTDDDEQIAKTLAAWLTAWVVKDNIALLGRH